MAKRYFLVALMIIAVLSSSKAQMVMGLDGQVSEQLCMGSSTTLYNPSLDSSRLGTPIDGRALVQSILSEYLSVRVSFSLCDTTSHLVIYDGMSTTGSVLADLDYTMMGLSPLDLTATSGAVFVRYTSSSTDSCFDLFTINFRDQGISNVSSANVTGVSAQISWSDLRYDGPWTIRYGTNRNNLNQIVHARTNPYLLQGLNELTTYYYQVYRNDSVLVPSDVCPPQSLTTRCDYERSGCIDYANLRDCRVSCTYGGYGSPTQYTGILDYGPSSNSSRHTVFTNRGQWDRLATRRGDTLWTIPPDAVASVRLGNPVREGQSEQISYRYHVDVRSYDLLVLKYAVVLENPDHSFSAQPRFDFSIYDAYGNVINPDCNSATYVPGYAMTGTWHTNGGIKWLDWNTLALDLNPFDGQDIVIAITTRDCIYAGHWGYGYFSLSCAHRRIESLHCGADVSNTFRAPAGFTYQWFDTENPSQILSNSDSLYVSRIGTFGCRMSFMGNNPAARCEFVSNAVAGPRFPHAAFDTLCTDTINCKFRFHMTNNSRIAADEDHTTLTDFPCEDYEWIIDDDEHFYTTDLTYDFPYGHHKLQLVAKLSGGLCSDTLTYIVYRYPVCRVYDTIRPSICSDSSYAFFGETYNLEGRYRKDIGMFTHTLELDVRPTSRLDTSDNVCDSMRWDFGMIYNSGVYVNHLSNSRNCDSTRVLNLIVRKSSDTVFHDTCVENVLPRAVGYTAFTDTVRDTLLHVINHVGCDSSILYSLHIWWNVFSWFDTTLCNHYLPIKWGPFTFTEASTKSRTLSGAASHGEDSTVTLTLYANPDYYDYFIDTIGDREEMPYTFRDRQYIRSVTNDSFYMTSINGCDSVVFFSLWIDYHTISCDTYLQFPNMVSPNGDGVNDGFVIINLLENDCYRSNMLVIYDRWGAIVYNAENINSLEQFWYPTHDIPDGTYYYYFKGSGPQTEIQHHGVIEVIR